MLAAAPAASGPSYDELPRVPAGGGRGRGDRSRRRRRPAAPGRGCTWCTCRARSSLPTVAAAKADGVRLTVETCPHYLDAARRGRARRRDAVQVLPADPRAAPTATRSGQGWPTAPSTWWSATTRRAPPTSSASTPATSAPRGAASRRCSSACRWSGPRRARRGHDLADVVALDGRGTGRAGRAAPRRAALRERRRGRPGGLRAGRRAGRGPGRGCTTGTRSSPYAGRAAARRRPRDVVGWTRATRTAATHAARAAAGARGGRDRARRPADAARPGRRARFGGGVVWANDELFAGRENLVNPGPATFSPHDVRAQGPGLRRLGDPAPAPHAGHD